MSEEEAGLGELVGGWEGGYREFVWFENDEGEHEGGEGGEEDARGEADTEANETVLVRHGRRLVHVV